LTNLAHQKLSEEVALGPISYDKKGDITTVDYVFYKWSKDGKYDEIPAGKGS
jgi:hypothetical protein